MHASKPESILIARALDFLRTALLATADSHSTSPARRDVQRIQTPRRRVAVFNGRAAVELPSHHAMEAHEP